jgi:hypothetical protein
MAGFYGNFGIDNLSFVGTATSTPEPSTWAMLLIGFAGIGYAGYRQRWRQRSRLVNPQSGRCLEVAGGADTERLQISDRTTTAGQVWRLP